MVACKVLRAEVARLETKQTHLARACGAKFCLLQIPDQLGNNLALFAGAQPLHPDQSIKKAAKAATSRYYAVSLAIVIMCFAPCVGLSLAGFHQSFLFRSRGDQCILALDTRAVGRRK
jgi:hypothetical protein